MLNQKNKLLKLFKSTCTKKTNIPKILYPELCTLVKAPPVGDEWIHEIKFDGYRLLCFIQNKKITLYTRSIQDWTAKFPAVVNAIKKLNLHNAIFDGEVVVFDKQKRSNFQLLQNAIGDVTSFKMDYYIFDLLYYDEYDFQNIALIKRKALLEEILPKKDNVIHFSEHVCGNGMQIYKKVCAAGLEGVISKLADSSYIQSRSREWLKSKCIQRQEFIIVGFTPPSGQRQHFGAILIAVYSQSKKLQYCGRVGTGFNEKSLQALWKQMVANKISNCPLEKRPLGTKHVTWVKPKLVAEVEFTEWTTEGILRHPSFKGLRYDKSPTKIIKERPKTIIKRKTK